MIRTRAEASGEYVQAVDPDTGQVYVTALSRTGRPIDKNRSDNTGGYKSHLTLRQRQIIAWYLRQRHRGCARWRVWEKLQESGAWQPSPMQYPLTFGTLAAWELTWAAEAAKGRDWPSLY